MNQTGIYVHRMSLENYQVLKLKNACRATLGSNISVVHKENRDFQLQCYRVGTVLSNSTKISVICATFVCLQSHFLISTETPTRLKPKASSELCYPISINSLKC